MITKTKFYVAITNMISDAKTFLSEEDYKELILDLDNLIGHKKDCIESKKGESYGIKSGKYCHNSGDDRTNYEHFTFIYILKH